MNWIYILIFIGSCFVLVRSGTWVVKSLSRISSAFGWSEFMVSFLFMSLASSLPELFIGLSSAWHKIPQLSFGNVLGANILNLTLGIGITVLVIGGLKLERLTTARNSLYTAILAFLPIFLMFDGEVSRVDGIILLGALGIYLKRVLIQKKRFEKPFRITFNGRLALLRSFLGDFFIFFGAVALMILSAEGIIYSARVLAESVNLPLVLSGIVFVSLGTVLPELTFGIKAALMGRQKMILGNFIGTVVINSTLILGLVSIICPLRVANFSPYFTAIIFTLLAIGSFVIFSRTRSQIGRKEALLLLAIYFFFVFFQLLVK